LGWNCLRYISVSLSDNKTATRYSCTSFLRRIERIERRFDFHDKTKYPVDLTVGIFSSAWQTPTMALSLFFSFFSRRFATIDTLAASSRLIEPRKCLHGICEWKPAKWQTVQKNHSFFSFSFSFFLDEAAVFHVLQSLLHTGYFTDIALFFLFVQIFRITWNKFFPWVDGIYRQW